MALIRVLVSVACLALLVTSALTQSQAVSNALIHDARQLALREAEVITLDALTALRAYNIDVWDLKRTKSYGSKHYNQRPLTISRAELSSDNKTVTLTLPDLAPTWGMSIKYKLNAADGTPVTNELHNTIHHLNSSR